MTVPIEAVSVCKTGAPPETSTMLFTSPTSRATSMRFELPTCTSMFFRSTARKPGSSTFRLYTPGGMARRTYNPASFVNAVRIAFVAGLVNVTVTPGTIAPLGSTTTPLMSPDGACAASLRVNRITKNNVENERLNMDTSCLLFNFGLDVPYFGEVLCHSDPTSKLGTNARDAKRSRRVRERKPSEIAFRHLRLLCLFSVECCSGLLT